MARLKAAQAIWAKARERRDTSGKAWLAPAEVSRMLRERVKAEFPGVAFRVSLRHGTSITVAWTDGPYYQQVDAIAQGYSFGDFDGMIDLACSISNWLLPDGTLAFASSRGTAGSGGAIAGQFTDCPAPGAVLVDSIVKYTFCERDMSDAYIAAAARDVCSRYGIDFDNSACPRSVPLPDHMRHGGMWTLYDLIYRDEQDKARELMNA